MDTYCVSIEHDLRTLDIDAVMEALATAHPAIGRSDTGRVEIAVTVPGESLAQAVTLAIALSEQATGSPAAAVTALTEIERDTREGWAPLPELVNVTQAAEKLGISRQAVLKRINTGALPHQRVGREYVIPAAALN